MRLKSVLGPIQLVFYGVGVIVGAGVYSVIGTAAGLAQHHLWVSFALGAGVAFLTAISYAEMATSYPEAGAEYIYIRRAWPKANWLSFGVGVVMLLGAAATAATSNGLWRLRGCSSNCRQPCRDGRCSLPVPPSTSGVCASSSWVNMLFTSIEIGGLLLSQPVLRAKPVHRRRLKRSLRSWRRRHSCFSSTSASRRLPI